MDKIVNYLAHFHKKDNTLTTKIASLLGGVIVFLIIFPLLFIRIGLFVRNSFSFELNKNVEYPLAVLSLIFGLYMLIWTTFTQWNIGKGTPAPNAPTQHLITSGPYRLCRNPIELGAIFYYLGLGTLYGGIITGIVCFLLGVVVGSLYHKFIEEKELELRFGDEYKEYKKVTPFLFPKLKKKDEYDYS